jgi:predicted transcriptional regulator
LNVSEIAEQLGTTPATITRSMTKFREMSGLAAGGVRFVRPGAGSNGDNPAAVQA